MTHQGLSLSGAIPRQRAAWPSRPAPESRDLAEGRNHRAARCDTATLDALSLHIPTYQFQGSITRRLLSPAPVASDRGSLGGPGQRRHTACGCSSGRSRRAKLMMISFPVHLGRISPLFDAAVQAVRVDVCRGRVLSMSRLTLPGTSPFEQVRALAAAEVQALVCGAISRAAVRELLEQQIRVWPGVAGDVDAVLESLVRQGAPEETLRMPGCRGRGMGRGRGDRWRWGWQSPPAWVNRGERRR